MKSKVDQVIEFERVRLMVAPIDPELSAPDSEPHWACPDCGMPCRCVGVVRYLRHERCTWEEP